MTSLLVVGYVAVALIVARIAVRYIAREFEPEDLVDWVLGGWIALVLGALWPGFLLVMWVTSNARKEHDQ
jgi:hypothetical protein